MTLVIWNASAGKADAVSGIRERVERSPDVTLFSGDSAAAASAEVERRIREGERRIVVAGGDGTINSTLNGIMRTGMAGEVVLGILPIGTANDWCSSLAIPDDLDEAWQLALGGQSTRVDIAEVVTGASSEFFANIATGGNSQRVTESLTSEMKQNWGALCYLRGALGELAELESFQTQVLFDEGPEERFEVWNIIVANGRTSAGRLAVAPRAKLDDGLLDVVLIKAGTLVDLAGTAMQFLIDDYTRSDQVVYRQARTIALRSDPPLRFSIDGNLVDEPPVVFKTHALAIGVVVGPDYDRLV